MDNTYSVQYAVIGNPVAHSLSPVIHQFFARLMGMELVYGKLQADEQAFEAQVYSFFAQGGLGLNVTAPYKRHAFAMSEQATERCKLAQAANTLWISNGQLHADNTDGVGLVRDLQQYVDLKEQSVLILGAGGAACGIVSALLNQSLKQLTVANRTLHKALELQRQFPGVRICALNELEGEYDVIINAVSAQAEMPQRLEHVIRRAPLCYDLAYVPTAFGAWARRHGLPFKSGLGMLVEQAAESFAIWHGVKPDTHGVVSLLKGTPGPC